MKKVICKVEYDTEVSEIVAKFTSGEFGDAQGYEESLYKTEEGKFFLYVNGGEDSKNDSFGLIGLCSIGPIVSVLLLRLFFNNGNTEYIASEEKFGFHTHVRFLALSELCWTNPKIRNYENFEQRVEKMRAYFEARGMIIPPRKIYNGYSFDGAENMTYFDRRMKGFTDHWFTDVDYEYNLFKDLTK